MSRPVERLSDSDILSTFIGHAQLEVLSIAVRGEEGDYFKELIRYIVKHIRLMPSTNQQEAAGKNMKAYLHYFAGCCDWWIFEKDMYAEQMQAFGLADLGIPTGAELGYICIPEILDAGAELDFHWEPKTYRQIKEERNIL